MMTLKIAEDIYLVGDGHIRLSDPRDCHVYLIDGGTETGLVDAGSGLATNQIMVNIRRDGLHPERLSFLVVTHSHADHGGGAHDFKAITGCEVYAPTVEADFLDNGGKDMEVALGLAKKSKVYPRNFTYKHCKVDKVLKDQQTIRVGKYTLKTIQVPGHSHGIVCLLLEGGRSKTLFSSDVVFLGGTVGLGNWPGCSLDAYRDNIGKLGGLGVRALFPGHFLWTLKDGQKHIDTAINNLKQVWVPPAWQHKHPHA